MSTDGTPEGIEPSTTGDRALAVLLLSGGLVGLAAAFTLVLEKLALLGDATYTPTCSLNPVLNCGSVMKTPQAELFGFPNPLIGIATFPVLIATGAVLLAGARPARWYWLGLQAGVTLGVTFVGWLIFQSLYRIGALCPYCMVVWTVVVPMFWYVSLRNANAGVLGVAVARSRVVRALRDWHLFGLVVLALIVVGLILEQFWYYWRTVLS